ncbi:SDR family NAD(P)-dependent oxidoreductase [Tamlana flava]|uniref:SDR family NAD(P)-dependent oxidoreductase n=1 Tax=Tamlana flava TaxID=3158572 RepID=UPI00351B778C
MEAYTLKNKVVLITGSSQGIGKATALCFGAQGACIMLNGRNKEKLIKAEKELRLKGLNVDSFCADITNLDNAKKLIDKTINSFGKLDILVNNAGVSMRGKFSNLNSDVFKRVFDINVFASVNLSKLALPYLRNSKGSLVFVSSVAGIRGLPSNSAYCSSKMALRAVAESIRIEEAKSNIHVGLVYVGITEIEKGKTTISENGSLIELEDRSKYRVHSKGHVASRILENIRKRKFITTLTWLGKLNFFMQKFTPILSERILIWANRKVQARSL